jgi:hypothetical protein
MAIFKWNICVSRLKIPPPTVSNYHFLPSCLHVLLLVPTSQVIFVSVCCLLLPCRLYYLFEKKAFCVDALIEKVYIQHYPAKLNSCKKHRAKTHRSCFCPRLSLKPIRVKQAGYARMCVVEDSYVAMLLDPPCHEHDHRRRPLS